MTPFAIAALQLNLKTSQNLETVIAKTRATVKRYPWVQMVVTSELAIPGSGLGQVSLSLDDCEPALQALADELNIWLVPGSIYEKCAQGLFNTSPVISPQGDVVARYRKMYPFLPYEKGVAAGSEICVFDVPGAGRFGLSICYDIWFPEVSRAMATQGAAVLLHPTMTDTCDRDVEKAMIRATSAQQQCYVIDVNGTGDQACGQSMLTGPDGEILHQASVGEETMLIEVDFDRVARCRERGLMGLGQPLKSFRDAAHTFPQEGLANRDTYLDTLGPLAMPRRET